MSTRLVVVGGDAAGMSAASHVVRERDDIEVVVVERGHYTSYSMCGIPYLVAGSVEDPEDLVSRSPQEHRRRGIDVRMSTEAIGVDADRGVVRIRDLQDGGESDLGYDLLLLTPGAHPVVPEGPGLAEHSRVVHTLDEGASLRAVLDSAEDLHRVVTVGAGYIGLEVAEALVQRGLESHLIDRAPQVMKTLDEDMAEIVAERLTEEGVRLHLGESLLEVRGDEQGCSEVITDRGTYAADTVVLAMGGKPNVALAVEAGCELGETGAVLVDERMRTTVPGIWAAGDVVESTDLVGGGKVYVPLGTHANKQGKVVGVDLAAYPEAGDARFPGVVGTAVTRLCDLEVARVGLSSGDCQSQEIDHVTTRFTATARAGYMPDPGVVHVKMLAERPSGRILGCQLVGTGNVAKRIDVAAVWCTLGTSVADAQLFDLSYAPPFGGVWDLLQVAARKLTKELGLSPQL